MYLWHKRAGVSIMINLYLEWSTLYLVVGTQLEQVGENFVNQRAQAGSVRISEADQSSLQEIPEEESQIYLRPPGPVYNHHGRLAVGPGHLQDCLLRLVKFTVPLL